MSCSALLIWKEKWLDKRVESAVWPVTSLLYFRSGFNIARHIHFRDEYFFINCKNKLLLFLNSTEVATKHFLFQHLYYMNIAQNSPKIHVFGKTAFLGSKNDIYPKTKVVPKTLSNCKANKTNDFFQKNFWGVLGVLY